MPPRCRRDSAAVPPRCRRDSAAIPPRCCRDSAAMPPWIAADPDFFSISKSVARSVVSMQRYRSAQFSSGSINRHHRSVSIGSIWFRIDQKSPRIGIDRLKLVENRSKIITDQYRSAQFGSGSIQNQRGSVSIGSIKIQINID